MNEITHAEIRMYKMGTGDCFIVKFFEQKTVKFKMMIDAGTISGSSSKLRPFIEDLLAYVDNHLDLLVVTHEHEDHVLAFERCKDLFLAELKVDQIWLGWTEEDGKTSVEKWKTDFGQKKLALAMAVNKLSELKDSEDFKAQFNGSRDSERILAARQNQIDVVADFAQLQNGTKKFSVEKSYVGDLDGLRVVKRDITAKNGIEIQYLFPGTVLDEVIPGVKFYVLGPPNDFDQIKQETGGEGETFSPNFALDQSNTFAAAVLADQTNTLEKALPFDEAYVVEPTDQNYSSEQEDLQKAYQKDDWRKIDHDWLLGAGALALRLNSLTNNLSVVLAIEIVKSGKVLLFPGDAEYGSWNSWHKIDWAEKPKDPNKHLTEDLLNRTVFYKVAHHLSHNGTAQRLGLRMMTHKDLAAMATLDYSVIRSGWKNTMPNRGIMEELLQKTKGRVMIMNEKELMIGAEKLSDSVVESRKKMTTKEKKEFNKNLKTNELFVQYTVKF